MQRFLDPTNDVAFKKIFGTEAQKPALISFLNAVLNLSGDRSIVDGEFIENIDLPPQESLPDIDKAKRTIFDIKCCDQAGREFIVEMQNRNAPDFLQRCQYYLAKKYSDQLKISGKYTSLRLAVLVALSNFNLFDDDTDPISHHHVVNVKTQKRHLKEMAFVFVELPKFKKTEDELVSVQDKWLYLLRNAKKDDHIPKAVTEREITETYETLDQFSWSEGERDAYVRANMVVTDNERRLEEREEKGREEGREEEKEAIALNLLKLGQSLAIVSQATDLSESEILELAQTIQND
jgi:predicted transposase/invertase (TIGR01784 family)